MNIFLLKHKNICAAMLFVLFSDFIFSCTTKPSAIKTPAWAADMSAVYPSDKYITGHGYGKTKANAESAGLSTISRFFNQSISVKTEEKTTVNTDGVSSSTINDETFVQSQTELFAVRYAQAYFNESTGEWETVAYIDRNEAWNIYEPLLKQKTDSFKKLYQDAENENDSFKKVILYSKADNFSKQNDIERMLDFAIILHPAFAGFYSGVRDQLSQIPSKIIKAKSLSSLYIECKNDYENMIYSSLVKAFDGFPVTRDKNSAKYICTIELNENMKEMPAGIFYTPVVSLRVANVNGVVFSSGTELKRIGAKDPAIAKQRMYTSVANNIQQLLTYE